MKKAGMIFLALATLAVLTSCADQYRIQGTSNVSMLDGHMLYLKLLKENDLRNIDSCEVVHGKFNFGGVLDTARLANIFMDDESVMPIILESGDILVSITNTEKKLSGTPLNDSLFVFMKKYNQLQSQEAELVHTHDQAIMDGSDMENVIAALNARANQLAQQEDELITRYVTQNFDNALGPGLFFLFTIENQIPQLTPWIEDIWSKATENFKNDPYVKSYYEKARENQSIMNGMKAAPAPPQQDTPNAAPAPTPNELAKPAQPEK